MKQRMPATRIYITLLTLLGLGPLFSAAFSWKFSNNTSQCGTTQVSILGSGGRPPYYLWVVPYGRSPLATEPRTVIDVPFADTSTTATFKFAYPANSQFLAVVSQIQTFSIPVF